MDDIDKRLDEIIADRVWFIEQELNAGQNVQDVLHNAKDELQDKIKQLMADDFEKRLSEISKDFRPELIDMSNKDYHPDIAPGFSIGFNLAKNLIIKRAKELERWKKQ